MILYPDAIPLAEDGLHVQKFQQRAVSALLNALLGASSIIVDGFACVPTVPGSLAAIVGPGSVVAAAAADANPFSVLPADSTSLLKQGDITVSTTFPVTAPTSPGQSIAYLIQATFQEVDGGSTVLPYYNASDPNTAWNGPNNSNTAQTTMRLQSAVLSLKAGAPASTGTQTVPAADTGYAPLWIITVAYGQTTVAAANIAIHPQAPFIPWKLPQLAPGFSRAQTFTSPGVTSWTVPNGVTRVKARVVGGGGGGAQSSSTTQGAPVSSGGGGGAGGYAIGVYAVTPGQVIPVTVGGGGGSGGTGGASSFGTFATAFGGAGSQYFDSGNSCFGGSGGSAVGGNILNATGGLGSDGQSNAFTTAGNGAAGPFGGAGRAAAGGLGGFVGQAPGAGGGGSYNGTGSGGAGAPGIVIVEY